MHTTVTSPTRCTDAAALMRWPPRKSEELGGRLTAGQDAAIVGEKLEPDQAALEE